MDAPEDCATFISQVEAFMIKWLGPEYQTRLDERDANFSIHLEQLHGLTWLPFGAPKGNNLKAAVQAYVTLVTHLQASEIMMVHALRLVCKVSTDNPIVPFKSLVLLTTIIDTTKPK